VSRPPPSYDRTITPAIRALDYGSGDNFLAGRWTFRKAGEPLLLLPGNSFRVTVNDDLTGLVEHYFCIQGLVEKFDPTAASPARFYGS